MIWKNRTRRKTKEKRILGKGLEVSAVGLGCMGFSHAYGAPTDRAEAVSMIQSAYEMEYLRRAHAVCPVTAVENRYSMMARRYEELFPVLEELGIGLVAFSPMANGFLTARYGKGEQFDPKYDYRSNMPQFKDEAIDKNRKLLELLQTIAENRNATPAQISMAWMLCKKPWIVPIPGTRKAERMRENMGAADVKLSAEDVKVLDDALERMEMSQVFGGSRIAETDNP